MSTVKRNSQVGLLTCLGKSCQAVQHPPPPGDLHESDVMRAEILGTDVAFGVCIGQNLLLHAPSRLKEHRFLVAAPGVQSRCKHSKHRKCVSLDVNSDTPAIGSYEAAQRIETFIRKTLTQAW